jgi:hypothetical protein
MSWQVAFDMHRPAELPDKTFGTSGEVSVAGVSPCCMPLWCNACQWAQCLWVETRPRQWIFKVSKNLQHTFLRWGSKAGGPMSYNFTASKKSLASMNKSTLHGQILIFFTFPFCLLPDDSAGRIAKGLCWMNWEFSSVEIIIVPWCSMLIYHLGDEQ